MSVYSADRLVLAFIYPLYKNRRGGFAPAYPFYIYWRASSGPRQIHLSGKAFPLLRFIKTGGMVSPPLILFTFAGGPVPAPALKSYSLNLFSPSPRVTFPTSWKSHQKSPSCGRLFRASGKKWFFLILRALRSARKKPLFTFGPTQYDRARRWSPPARQWGKGE